MKTRNLVTTKQIDNYTSEQGGYLKVDDDMNKEFSLKRMLTSAFAYGGIDETSHSYKKYILPHKEILGEKLFTEIENEMLEHFSKCSVLCSVYTDSEGCTYNQIIEN